jgi:aconitate hydratase
MAKGTVAQKIIAFHLVEGRMAPGEEIGLRIDQVLIQDLTGTQAMMHFEAMGLPRVRCRVAVAYADHNVLQVKPENMEDHLYLASACRKYGVWYAKPGTGIGHQIHLERFAVPGETALGADSHTPHCGGVGMLAIGAGGMDVAVAMAGGPYYVDMPYIVGVRLVGELRPWATAKDVILELLRRFTVRGNAGKLLEFFGPGIQTLNAQQRVTITNMGTEIGVLTSLFPSDGVTRDYFRRLGRLEDWREVLPDPDVEYDDVVELDLSKIEPLVALPSNPDKVVPVREAAGIKVHQVMVGSCTNGSYTDLQAVAKIVRGRRVHPDVTFFVHASSRADLELLAREGLLADLVAAGVNVSEPTCGACIGIGHVPAPGTRSVRAINRNFKGRSGLKDDEVYLTSPETAAATALMGVLTDPRDLGIPAPTPDLPESLPQDDPGLVPPLPEAEAALVEVERGPNIVPAPVKGPLGEDLRGRVLIKLGDDISTDHISPAGSEYLAYRSNVPKLAEFTFARVDPEFSKRAREWGGGFIVGGENYGQGSSREHAAIAPMYLGVHGVIAKSFARIHHANLINWGLVPMTFEDPADWERLEQGDELEIPGIREAIRRGDERLVVRNRTKGTEFPVRVNLSARERAYILAGGKLAHTKQHPIV